MFFYLFCADAQTKPRKQHTGIRLTTPCRMPHSVHTRFASANASSYAKSPVTSRRGKRYLTVINGFFRRHSPHSPGGRGTLYVATEAEADTSWWRALPAISYFPIHSHIHRAAYRYLLCNIISPITDFFKLEKSAIPYILIYNGHSLRFGQKPVASAVAWRNSTPFFNVKVADYRFAWAEMSEAG